MTDYKVDNNNGIFKNAVLKLGLRFPVAEISRKTGFAEGNISRFLNDKATVSDKFLEKFSESFNINLEDLTEVSQSKQRHPIGGLSVLDPYFPKKAEENLVIEHQNLKKIPFYNINVSAGNIIFSDVGLVEGTSPDDFMYIPAQVDADVSFPTYGDSMYPEITNGDWVAYKFLKDWSFFNYGMMYLIATEEQRMVKYIKRHPKEGYILLESRNEDFEPIDMPISSIKSILQVRYIGKIKM